MAGRIKVGIAGALGRMGRALAAGVEARGDLEIGALFDRPGSEGQLIEHEGSHGHVLVSRDQALASCQVILDFTAPEASSHLVQAALERGGPALVIGSTGLNPAQEEAIVHAGSKLAIVRTGNFSLGVNLLMGLVEETARRLNAQDWDVEIFEAHHKRKVDAPSGTALMLGEAAAKGRNVKLADVAERGRDGLTGARKAGAIGFSVMRGGGIVGEHSVTFAAEDELVTISHTAMDRSLFARGAVEAAVWVTGRRAGLYSMMDVLGFNDR